MSNFVKTLESSKFKIQADHEDTDAAAAVPQARQVTPEEREAKCLPQPRGKPTPDTTPLCHVAMDEGFSRKRMVDPFPYITGSVDRYSIDRADCDEFSFLCYSVAASSIVFIDIQYQQPVSSNTGFSLAYVEIAIPILVLQTGTIRTRVFFLDSNCLLHTDVFQLLRRLLQDPHVLKIGHKMKMEFSHFSDILAAMNDSKEVLDKAYVKDRYGSPYFKHAADYAHSALQMFFMFYEEISKANTYPYNESTRIPYPRFEYCLLLNIIEKSNQLPVPHLTVPHLNFKFKIISIITTIDIFEDCIAKRMRQYSEAIHLAGFCKDEKSFSERELLCSDYKKLLKYWPMLSPWNGYPKFLGKFLCDPTLIGLAKYLRYVAIDAHTLPSKKLTTREMLTTAYSDQRILLTRNEKLLKFKCLSSSQIYAMEETYLEAQFLEVIQKFRLEISKSEILSRCGICGVKLVEGEPNIDGGKVWNCPQCLFKRIENKRYHHLIAKLTRLCNLDM